MEACGRTVATLQKVSECSQIRAIRVEPGQTLIWDSGAV